MTSPAAQPSLPHDELRRVQLNTVLLELCHAVSSQSYDTAQGQEAFKKASDQVYDLILAQRQEAVKAFAEGLKKKATNQVPTGSFHKTAYVLPAVLVTHIDAALQTYLEGEEIGWTIVGGKKMYDVRKKGEE